MGHLDSCRITRVRHYSGTSYHWHNFRIQGYHLLWRDFPDAFPNYASQILESYNPGPKTGLGYSRFARHYWGNLVWFLFRRYWDISLLCVSAGLKPRRPIARAGFPIRRLPGHWLLTPYRHFSQWVASFIRDRSQGIHSIHLSWFISFEITVYYKYTVYLIVEIYLTFEICYYFLPCCQRV